MSIKIMARLWGLEGLTANEWKVLMAFADHSDDDGVCWPGLRGLAEKCAISRRSVQRHLASLVEKKLIEAVPRYREDGSQASSIYRLFPNPAPPSAETDTPPGQGCHGGVDSAVQGGATVVSPLEPSGEPSGKDPVPPRTPHPEDPIFKTFYDAYPKKKNRPAALRAWNKASKEDSLPTLIDLLAILEKHKAQASWGEDNGKFIPHPATWLNGRQWEDEVKKGGAGKYDNETEDERHERIFGKGEE